MNNINKNRLYLYTKIISIVTLLSIILNVTGLNAFAASNNKISIENIEIIGEKMAITDYKNLYGKPFSERSAKQELDSYQSATLQIDKITISNNQIIFDYSIENYREVLEGTLYNSSRNLDNIVAVFANKTNYEVLFFELTKGIHEINLLYNTELNNQPHIKIYLKDNRDCIYLFETELPEQLSDISVDNDQHCDVYKDYLWYVNIVDAYETNTNRASPSAFNTYDRNAEIKRNIAIASNTPYEPELSIATTTSTEPMMWGGKEIYEMSVSNGVDQTTYMFYPYGYVRGTPVSTTGENTWWGSVEVSEHAATKMIGSPAEPTVTYGINRFSIRNAKISAVSGNYTLIVRTYIQGRVKKNSSNSVIENGTEITAKIFKKALSYAPYGKTATEILSWLSLITQQVDNEVTLGGSGIDLSSGYNVGVKFALDSKYNITKYSQASKGHSVKMHIVLSRTQSSSAMTTGAIRINYDVYTNIYDLHDSHQVEKSFLYSDNDYDNGYRGYYY